MTAEAGLELRYPFAVRWPRWELRGWLEVRDCVTGEWLLIPAREAPPDWRRRATLHKRQQQAQRAAA